MGKQGGATAQTVKRACTPRPGTFDSGRRDTILDLTDLVDGRIDSAEFFAENYVTEGMRTLLTEGFRRLEGRSTQGVFKLTQAMGGGKTHNLVALGLLDKHPEYRADVIGSLCTPVGVLRYFATQDIDHWGTDVDAACVVAGAVDNDHV